MSIGLWFDVAIRRIALWAFNKLPVDTQFAIGMHFEFKYAYHWKQMEARRKRPAMVAETYFHGDENGLV